MKLAAGTVVGRYRVLGPLGRGGMATVYRVRHVERGTDHVLKVLTHAGDPERLFLEGRVQARLHHPNVVEVTDVIDAGGAPGLIMALVVGPDLRALVGERVPFEALDGLVAGILAGVGAAHAEGFVHRDLKPANILLALTEGGVVPKIADFGLAKVLGGDALALTRSGATLGTPHYMAPEQVHNARHVDQRADLFSLGAILYELVSGAVAFEGASLLEILQNISALRYRSLGERFPGAPERMVRSVDAALKARDERVATVDELWALWRPAEVALVVAARREVPWPPTFVARLAGKAPSVPDAQSEGPARTWAVGEPDLEVTVGLTLVGPPQNLPAERGAFVGRQDELGRLGRLVDDGARLVTIVGLGGAGKTRLAAKFGYLALAARPGGVWFFDLSEAKDLDGVHDVVARTLNIPMGPGDAAVQLAHALAGRGRCLLIFDNFEQVQALAARTLGLWLERAREATFVVTSREVLGLPGEALLSLDPLSHDDAVELLLTRARDAEAPWSRSAADHLWINELVRLLDGLPLAIELAAARGRMMGPDQLVARMSERFRLLTAGAQRGRQGTLRGVLDWSWELLSADEQAALAQIAVFEGGFTLEAAEAVLVTGELWAVDAVRSLVDKSLIRATGQGRFGVLLTVQAYAAEKLDGSGDKAGAEARHGAFFARLGSVGALDALDRHGGFERRRALGAELDNLVAACRRAAGRGDAAVAVGALRGAWAALDLRGGGPLGVALAREVLAMGSPEVRGPALAVLGVALRDLGQTVESLPVLEEALAWLDERGRRLEAAGVMGSIATSLVERGQRERALALFEEALAIQRELGDRRAEGVTLTGIGVLHHYATRFEEAGRFFERGLEVHREVGNRRSEAILLGNLAMLASHQGRTAEARALAEAGLTVVREVGDRRTEGIGLGNLGILAFNEGALDEAAASFEAALGVHLEVGNRRSESIVRANLGTLRRLQGRLVEGRRHHEVALSIHQELKNPYFEASTRMVLVVLSRVDGRPDEARAHWDAAVSLVRGLGDARFEGAMVVTAAETALLLGHLDLAAELFEAARPLVAAAGDEVGQGKIERGLAEVASRRGRG